MLTWESRLLHVVPSKQEADENRCSGTAKGAYPGEPPPLCCAQQARSGREQVQWNWARCLPRRAASSMLCPADKKQVRTGAMELGKVLTSESRLLHVVPGGQEAGENRRNGTGQVAYPREPPPPCCARRTRSGWELPVAGPAPAFEEETFLAATEAHPVANKKFIMTTMRYIAQTEQLVYFF